MSRFRSHDSIHRSVVVTGASKAMLHLRNQPVVISRGALVNDRAVIVIVIVWIIIRIVPRITVSVWISETAAEEDMAVMMVPMAAVYS